MPSSRRRFLALLGTSVTAGCSALSLEDRPPITVPSGSDAWAMPGGGPARTNANLDAPGPIDGAVERWTVPNARAIYAVDGSAFVSTAYADDDREFAGAVAKLDAETGAERWRVDTTEPADAMAVSDEFVAVPTRGNSFRALSPADGTQKWEMDLPSKEGHGTQDQPDSPLIANDTLYATTARNDVYAVAPSEGVRWHRLPETSWDVFRTLAVAENVVVQFRRVTNTSITHLVHHTEVTAFDAERGTEKWQFQTAGVLRGLAVAHGMVYVAASLGTVRETANQNRSNQDGMTSDHRPEEFLFALSPTDGTLQYRARPSFGMGSTDLVKDTIAAGQDALYYAAGDGIISVEAQTLRPRWKTTLDDQSNTIVVGDGVVYATADDTVYALDSQTGDVRWQFSTVQYARIEALAGDTLYVKNPKGIIVLGPP